VKGERFDPGRRVGAALPQIRVYNMRGVDELVFCDVAATPAGRRPDFQLIDELADECFMPFTVGGGVRTVDDFRDLLAVGADKVLVGTAAVDDPGLIARATERFGSQCVVVSIEFRRRVDGTAEVFAECGRRATGRDPVNWAREVEAAGAGEILLTAADRDGTMGGYDIEMIRDVTRAVGIPVVASGGAGAYSDLIAAVVEGGASAVAAASMFQFTEQTPHEAKLAMRAAGLPVRLSTPVSGRVSERMRG
jgi:cyclase